MKELTSILDFFLEVNRNYGSDDISCHLALNDAIELKKLSTKYGVKVSFPENSNDEMVLVTLTKR